MVSTESWTDFKNGSGKLLNPGKSFFLRLAFSGVRKVGRQRDKDNMLYTRKAKIHFGLARNLNGMWEEKQLFPKLQELMKRYREKFDGRPVADRMCLDGEATAQEV